MSFLPVYLDASAIVKLVVLEPETDALMSVLGRWPDRVTSVLSRAELHRALRRRRASQAIRTRAEAVLSSVVLVRMDDPVVSRAEAFRDSQVRTLDAIHLATALSLGDDPDAFITYDAGLARAASRQRLTVLHPGARRLS